MDNVHPIQRRNAAAGYIQVGVRRAVDFQRGNAPRIDVGTQRSRLKAQIARAILRVRRTNCAGGCADGCGVCAVADAQPGCQQNGQDHQYQ